MPVDGSTVTASWLKRPIALYGIGSTGPLAEAGTSNTQPCVFPNPSLGPTTVSSHVSQLPQGVGPPAQFTNVPAMLTQLPMSSRLRPTSRVVVPAPASGSYAFGPIGGTDPG